MVIGGYAAFLLGSALMTTDADVTPDPDAENLKRLCAVLGEVEARIRTPENPNGVEFRCDEHLLARMAMLNLVTRHGDFDLTFRPAGFPGGYRDLVDRSVVIDIGGFAVHVASLDDIIDSKEAANRDKDRATLPQLYALRDEIARLEQGSTARRSSRASRVAPERERGTPTRTRRRRHGGRS